VPVRSNSLRIERSPVRLALVKSYLLERLDAFSGTAEIDDQLCRGIPDQTDKFVEARSLEVIAGNVFGKQLRLMLQLRPSG
jgi:hypothetical protein